MSEDGAYASPDAAQPRAIGEIVRNRYRVLAVVGRGGLGVVYRVSDLLYSSNNVYALKELSDPAPGARKQFALESRWLQELDHNNIPKVRESFEWDDRGYLVMDYVDGENLEQYLRRIGRPLQEEQALRWMLPICDALQYLHTRTPPLLHRDVKPANIIVTPSGHPVLVDFGIAKAHLPGMNQTVTFVRKAGTEGYAPPEQYAATGLTGPWSDVYGLGATLYQLLTSQVPQTAVERITGDMPMPRPRALNPAITPGTDAAVMHALELKPANRYQTVTEFAAQMMEALQLARYAGTGLDTASFPSATSQPQRPPSSVSAPPFGQRSAASGPSDVSGRLGQPGIPRGAGAWGAQAHAGPASPAAPISANLPPLGNPIPSNLPEAAHPHPYGQLAASSAPRLAPTATQSRAPSAHAPAANERQSAPKMPAPQRQRRGPPLAVLIGILVVLMVAVGGLAVVAYQNFAPPDRSTPQATTTGYFNALEQQNYSRAWQFSSASRNDPSAQSSFISALSADDGRYGQVLRFTITQSQTDNAGHATLTVSVTRAVAPDVPLVYVVSVTQYSGDNWLIDSASSQ